MTDYVGVVAEGEFIFVIIDDREKFDLIATTHKDAGPNTETGGHCLVKVVGHKPEVIFQHWLVSPRRIADRRS